MTVTCLTAGMFYPTVNQIKCKVQECIDNLNKDEAKVRRIIGNLEPRAQLCIDQDGGHIEHSMK